MPEWLNQYSSQIAIALLALGLIAAGGLGYLLRGRAIARMVEEFRNVQQALVQTQQEFASKASSTTASVTAAIRATAKLSNRRSSAARARDCTTAAISAATI
jgi:DNA recombination protein RmuC